MLDFAIDFALLLFDEFDGRAIADANVLFRVDGRMITPLRKREGFYVFRGLSSPCVTLEIDRPHYHKESLRIEKARLDPGEPIVRTRLLRRYPGNFSDCEWHSGHARENAEIIAFSAETLKMQVGEDATRLTIPGGAAALLLGRRFATPAGETFLLAESLAPGVYRSDRAAAQGGEGTTEIARAYLARCDGEGRYDLPIERGAALDPDRPAICKGGDGRWVSLSQTARS